MIMLDRKTDGVRKLLDPLSLLKDEQQKDAYIEDLIWELELDDDDNMDETIRRFFALLSQGGWVFAFYLIVKALMEWEPSREDRRRLPYTPE